MGNQVCCCTSREDKSSSFLGEVSEAQERLSTIRLFKEKIANLRPDSVLTNKKLEEEDQKIICELCYGEAEKEEQTQLQCGCKFCSLCLEYFLN